MEIYQNGELQLTYNWVRDIDIFKVKQLIRDSNIESNKNVKVIETFGLYDEFYPLYTVLKELLELSTITEFKIDKVNNNVMTVIMEGNLLSIISIIQLSKITRNCETLYGCINEDLNVISELKRGMSDMGSSRSLLLTYISKQNYILDNIDTYHILYSTSFDKRNNYIDRCINKLYGVPLSKLEGNSNNKNTLSLSSISDSVLKKVVDYVTGGVGDS